MDWLDETRTGRLRAYMVSPTNLDAPYGELTGVQWSTLNLSAGYYTDARTTGAVDIADEPEWVRGSFIRLVYEIPEWGYSRELGTYAVVNDDATRSHGKWTGTLELRSMLYTMSTDVAPTGLTIAPGGRALAAIRNELQQAGRAYRFEDPLDYQFTGARKFSSGESRLSRCYALCTASGNRLDVDGHGLVTVSPYVEPAAKAPVLSLALDDPRGIVSDEVSRSTNWLEMPSRAAVTYRYTVTQGSDTVEKEITAYVDVSATSHANAGNRGYYVTDHQELADMSPATYSRALEIARQRLEAKSLEKVEWKLTTKYLPLWEGDVMELVIPDGRPEYAGARKCLVKNVELTGPYMDMSLTLKETASGDTEDDYE